MTDVDPVKAMSDLLERAFAPWIKQLNITPVSMTESGARFTLPGNDDLAREGGIVCGQALASVADTVGVLAISAQNGEFRPLTTVDMTTHFMRPVKTEDADVEVTIISNGRRMATARIDIRQQQGGKICAGATCAYAYLDG
ncbi:MAG: PaaI family thioesterase [Pseudomonadota bacterium]